MPLPTRIVHVSCCWLTVVSTLSAMLLLPRVRPSAVEVAGANISSIVLAAELLLLVTSNCRRACQA